MSVTMTSGAEIAHLEAFFASVWGDSKGYACIAYRPHDSDAFSEQFFNYPQELDEIALFAINMTQYDVWYCPQLFYTKQRRKEKVKSCCCLWSDLDTCKPELLLRQPTFAVISSPNRYQGIWVIKGEDNSPEILEEYSKRIAYYHAKDGADKSGWDLTQLLRVPFTHNFKYDNMPRVVVPGVGPTYHALADFDIYPELTDEPTKQELAFPDVLPDEHVVLEKNKNKIHPAAFVLLSREPKTDWSKALWQLETMLFESGLSREEVFVLVNASPCNKYERDQRSSIVLWMEVCRAASHVASKGQDSEAEFVLGPMLTEAERASVEAAPSIVKDYITMATEMTDAPASFHQPGAFVILSALLAGNIVVETDYGEIMPNLWFMILAGTTLARKTTAMDIAMDILGELDDDAVLATDGSIEGMLSGLADRDNRCSIFLRDEFSGLLDMMVKKDHYAGMLETFAKLYDGKAQKKVLSRQTIHIKKPVFLIYAGGIKSRILELLSSHHIDSGFLPRFVLVSADANLGALRPLGPKRAVVREKRDRMIARLQIIKDTYNKTNVATLGGIQVVVPKKAIAELTPEAWRKFQFFEAMMNHDATTSGMPEYLTPTFVRLTVSGLKAAVLLAAARCAAANQPLEVDEVDILEAFYYVEQWRKTAYEVVGNVGRSMFEVSVDKVIKMLERANGLMPKGTIMRNLKLTSKTASDLLETMEQRRLIVRTKAGKEESIALLEVN